MSAGSRENWAKLSKPMNSMSKSVQRVRLKPNASTRRQDEEDAEDDAAGR